MSKIINKTLILNKIKDTYLFKTDTAFANYLGIKPQTLSSWLSRNTFDIDLIYSKCVNINPEFLISGIGSVKRPVIDYSYPDSEPVNNIVSEPHETYDLKTDKKISEAQVIPLYNVEASAGIVSLFLNSNQTKPIDYIQIPNLPKCDGAVYVTGDSMYPLLKSGDIVMYKQIHNIRDGLFWGEMYLVSMEIDDEEFVTVKYIQKSNKGEDYICLVSQNKHHQDKDIELKKVSALGLIKGSIRINSMM